MKQNIGSFFTFVIDFCYNFLHLGLYWKRSPLKRVKIMIQIDKNIEYSHLQIVI